MPGRYPISNLPDELKKISNGDKSNTANVVLTISLLSRAGWESLSPAVRKWANECSKLSKGSMDLLKRLDPKLFPDLRD